jgi:archaellum component FlaC
MNDNKLLNQIGKLIDEKLKSIKKQVGDVGDKFTGVEKKVESVGNRLTGVEKKVESVDMKVELVNERIGKVHQELTQSIKQSQEETIESLSSLVHSGYNLQEKRIKKIEDHLQIPNPQ